MASVSSNGYRIKQMRSKEFWHFEVILDITLSKMEIVALQAIMGSDPKREAMNFLRARSKQYSLKQFNERGNLFEKTFEKT